MTPPDGPKPIGVSAELGPCPNALSRASTQRPQASARFSATSPEAGWRCRPAERGWRSADPRWGQKASRRRGQTTQGFRPGESAIAVRGCEHDHAGAAEFDKSAEAARDKGVLA